MDLRQIFLDINRKHFEESLPLPNLKWNSRLRATAGRFAARPRILWQNNQKATIEIATYLQKIENGQSHIRDTMLHEMIHYWLWYRGRPFGHNAEFYRKMRETGAKRYNPVPLENSVRHTYQCPNCKSLYPAKRKLKQVACSDCCKKFNQGYFHKKFQLILVYSSKEKTTTSATNKQESQKSHSTQMKNESHLDLTRMNQDKTNRQSIVPFEKVVDKIRKIRDLISNTEIGKNKSF